MKLNARLNRAEKVLEEINQDNGLRVIVQEPGMSREDALKNAGIEPDDDEGLIVFIQKSSDSNLSGEISLKEALGEVEASMGVIPSQDT